MANPELITIRICYEHHPDCLSQLSNPEIHAFPDDIAKVNPHKPVHKVTRAFCRHVGWNPDTESDQLLLNKCFDCDSESASSSNIVSSLQSTSTPSQLGLKDGDSIYVTRLLSNEFISARGENLDKRTFTSSWRKLTSVCRLLPLCQVKASLETAQPASRSFDSYGASHSTKETNRSSGSYDDESDGNVEANETSGSHLEQLPTSSTPTLEASTGEPRLTGRIRNRPRRSNSHRIEMAKARIAKLIGGSSYLDETYFNLKFPSDASRDVFERLSSCINKALILTPDFPKDGKLPPIVKEQLEFILRSTQSKVKRPAQQLRPVDFKLANEALERLLKKKEKKEGKGRDGKNKEQASIANRIRFVTIFLFFLVLIWSLILSLDLFHILFFQWSHLLFRFRHQLQQNRRLPALVRFKKNVSKVWEKVFFLEQTPILSKDKKQWCISKGSLLSWLNSRGLKKS